ncbi:MAG: bifunctional 5,10-methylenetetrahydrofolate dehydrogenase/5,10-methenyltetrahydrofolate cyclohydrolase [Deltaproteobacteria bacterium]|nr:bifunctional 5,10-methylenetetrahydrofolate dehydrogenase/5,10-methenyltetrahydrofolate cyclohydrolase [Deltaproteobacteria bacterium]
MAILLDGRALARTIAQGLAPRVAALPRAPGLAVVLVGSDPASVVYVRLKARAAEGLGLHHRQVDLPERASEAEVLATVDALNADPSVDGILVQLPLPTQVRREAVLDRVDPSKDVDGFHPENTGRLTQGRPRFVPCTPRGILALLDHHDVPLSGRRAVVVGRSPIVGRPVAALLDQRNATVTVCHTRTADLEAEVRRAEILVVAVGRPDAVPGAWVPPGAAVVDAGTNRLPDGRLVGDIAPHPALEAVGWITPTPGGVGPMTIAMLMANTVESAELRLAAR